MTENENLNIGVLFTISGVTVFFVVAVILALTGIYDFDSLRIEREWAEVLPDDVHADRALHAERLETYAEIDAEAGTVRIPVERAMELLIQERGNG